MSDIRGQHDAARPRYRVSSLSGSHIDDLDVAGYALGALELAERQVIDHHIRSCPACAERISQDMRTVGMLPFALASQLKPAPDVKAALFARIAHSQQAAAAAALPTSQLRHVAVRTQTIPSSRPEPATAASGEVGAPFLAARTGSRFNWLTAAVATPLLLALVLVGAWSYEVRSEMLAQQSTLSSQASELTSLKATLANFGSGDVQTVELQPQAGAPQAEGQLLFSPNNDQAIVRVDLNTLESAGSARILMNNNGSIEPIGDVVLDERGQGQATVSFDQPLTQGQSIQIQAIPVDPSVEGANDLLLSGTVNGMSDPGLGGNTVP